MTLSKRRIANSLLLIMVSLALYAFATLYGTPLYRVQTWSGWILATLLILLFFYSLRKKIIILPIGKASSWLQFHIYTGVLSMLVFFQHVSFHLPNGVFEIALALLFMSTTMTGVFGLILSRSIPKYLSRRGEDLIYERIPLFSYELRKHAKNLVIECTAQTHSTALADYYKKYLADFFYRPRRTFFHCYGSMNYLYVIQMRHNNFCRYLNKKEQHYAEKLFELITKKYDLDFHFTLQGVLKTWLFIHVPLTYLLMFSAAIHIMLVYAFLGHL